VKGCTIFFPIFFCYTQRLSFEYHKKNETKDAKCSKKWKVNVSFFSLPYLLLTKDFTEFGKEVCKRTNKYILMFCDTINTFSKKNVVHFNGGFKLMLCKYFKIYISLSKGIYIFKGVYQLSKGPSIKFKNNRWVWFEDPLSYTLFWGKNGYIYIWRIRVTFWNLKENSNAKYNVKNTRIKVFESFLTRITCIWMNT
jgi:hypothetical protein